jgi:hypothetical protein
MITSTSYPGNPRTPQEYALVTICLIAIATRV